MYGLKKGWMGPLEEQEAISSIALEISASLPKGWKSGVHYIMFMGGYSIAEMEIEDERGERTPVSIPASTSMNIRTLRSGMYRTNEGTWLSWKLELWAEGRFRSSFNYENRPPLYIRTWIERLPEGEKTFSKESRVHARLATGKIR